VDRYSAAAEGSKLHACCVLLVKEENSSRMFSNAFSSTTYKYSHVGISRNFYKMRKISGIIIYEYITCV